MGSTTVQWAPEQLPPLPDRPPLFPVATELPTGVFTPAELREARPYMKSSKVTGTDEVPNEIIRIMLEDALGFLLILEMLNFCWVNCTVPALWQIARVVAIFKQKGSARLPTNYRPISLLQHFSIVFCILDRS